MVFASFVYASCNFVDRRKLWADLHHFGSSLDAPCMVGRDFNCVLTLDEQLGGNPSFNISTDEFIEFVHSSALIDGGFSGSKYTWCNNQSGTQRRRARLDRILLN